MAHPPQASVIVPVYQHWHLVDGLLQAVALQSLSPETFEVILVNNGEPTDAPEREFAPNVRIVHCATAGSYAARNAGAREAAGEWLVFTDADCLPEPDWLAALIRAGVAHPHALHAGPVRMFASNAKPSRHEIYDMIRGIPQEHYVRCGYAATANLLVRRELFERLGGFDPARLSGGDAEFCLRAGAAGHGIEFVGDAVVRHPARADWLSLVTKARRVKGGQLTAGTARRRAHFLVMTILPPADLVLRFLRSRDHSMSHRLIAAGVQLGLWGIGILEAFRILILRQPPERR